MSNADNAPTPQPVEARADGVRVKALEWERPPISETLSRAETIIGTARVWTHHEANGSWFWKLGDLASGTEANAADAKKMLWLTYEHHILAALESTPAQPDPAAEIARLRKAYDGLWATWVESRARHLAAEARAERAESELAVIREAKHGPFGYLVMPIGLDEEHWRLQDEPETDPEYVCLPMFTEADPFAALANTADRGQEEKGK